MGTDSGATGSGTTGGEMTVCVGEAYPADAVVDLGMFGMEITGDDALAKLAGARCLLGGGLYLNMVTDLSALSNLERVSGGLAVTNSPALVSLNGLGALTYVGGNLVLDGNAALTDLSALGTLVSVDGILQVGKDEGNDAMLELPPLVALVEVEYISVSENDSLTNLGEPPSVQVGQGVAFANDPKLPHEEAVAWAEALAAPENVLVCGCLGSPAGECKDPGPAGS